MNVSILFKCSGLCRLIWILTTAGEAVPTEKVICHWYKLSALTSELLLGFKVEINKAIPTFHKAILFHLPLELDRQPFIDLHSEAFFIAVQG